MLTVTNHMHTQFECFVLILFLSQLSDVFLTEFKSNVVKILSIKS